MGSIVVYRYRPMRLVPTITTSVVIATGSSVLRRTVWVVHRGVNRQFGRNITQALVFLSFCCVRRCRGGIFEKVRLVVSCRPASTRLKWSLVSDGDFVLVFHMC